ncbi:MAG: ABC transporter ATP-binding protein [Gammaproteobacteria bacterium]|nr:ABC transporter ATP-binding protein [Gammaproteobacteria bacterium]
MTKPLLRIFGLCKSFGGIVATDHVELDILPGMIHAIIGPNGAGKTTLIAQVSGALKPDAGQIEFNGHDITSLSAPRRAQLGLSRSFQVTSVFLPMTVLENVMLAVQGTDGHSYRFWRPVQKDPKMLDKGMTYLQQVGLADRAWHLAAEISHGEQRQLEIAMALAMNPRLLLLDEPMAGMGLEESARMIRFLAKLREQTTILLIEHDMDAVFTLADTLSVLVHGSVIATDTVKNIRANPEVQRAYLGEEHA